jgi:hypothetical protein
MKQTIGLNEFRQAFQDYNRSDNFSYEGLELLFDYFEEVDENMELDVIAICCDFNEDNYEDIANNYSIDLDEYETEEEKEEAVQDYLQDNTCFIGKTDEGFVYQAF